MKKLPLVSITVASKNEEKNINRCLESIKKQTYPKNKIQVIVVDNNSTDNTKKIAKNFTKFVFNKGPERSIQRNFGMLTKSQGKYLLFLDADMTLASNTIKAAVLKLENSNLIALYIPEVVKGNSFWSKVRDFERQFYDATAIDGLRFFKANVFKKVSGFDKNLFACEDWDLDKRIKKLGGVGILSRSKNQVIYHHDINNLSLKKYISKKSYYSLGCKKYILKWGENDKDIKKQFGFTYRYFNVFLEKGKWKKFLSKPPLALAVYLIKFCLGIVFLIKQK